MSDRLGMAAQMAGNALRFGWYSGISLLLAREAGRRTPMPTPKYVPSRPVPSRAELMGALRELFAADARGVRDGLFPANSDEGGGLGHHFVRLRAMFADLPEILERRATRDASSAKAATEVDGLPDYFTQDFHFQTGGYLSEDSAQLYDVQVETLFYGSAGAMRRAGLRPIADHIRGRDQRHISMLDVACGTGRFLRQLRLTFPAAALTGLDLSRPYLSEAQRHMAGLRPARYINANAEDIPLPDGSQDVISSIFLYHELPPEVRRKVTSEIARVLAPGGIFIFIDSLQFGDRPGWDGLLEAFPVRFHEPYYRSYVIEDLPTMFESAGLVPMMKSLAFMSAIHVYGKPLS